VARFREAVAQVQREAEQMGPSMGTFDAITFADRIRAANSKTVDLPTPVIVYELTEGAIETLDDFSAVIWPREKEAFARNFQGEFYGVGIQISSKYNPALDREQLVVVSPLEDTPAYRAGLRAGDVIAAVDGRDTAGWSLDQAVREITGPKDTVVTLGILRTGEKQTQDFKLTRAKIPIESVRGWQHKAAPGSGWDYYVDPDQKIGYVRLSQFIPQTADDLDAAINQMEHEGGVNGLIIDLRFNPGGLLNSAVEVCDRFIRSGKIVDTVGPSESRTQAFYARPEHTHYPFPIVLLVNQGSASASEIVSGALQDYRAGQALIVGTRSFGKGSVQDVFPIAGNKAYLKLTTQYYRLPKGRIIHRQPEARTWGIEPDLKVPMTTQQVADELELRQKADVLKAAGEADDPNNPRPTAKQILDKAMDPQLSAALLVLETRLVAQQVSVAQGAGAGAGQ
jgi:carboxyl-terminal processing protease